MANHLLCSILNDLDDSMSLKKLETICLYLIPLPLLCSIHMFIEKAKRMIEFIRSSKQLLTAVLNSNVYSIILGICSW